MRINFKSTYGSSYEAKVGKFIDIELEYTREGYIVRINSKEIGSKLSLEAAKKAVKDTLINDFKSFGFTEKKVADENL